MTRDEISKLLELVSATYPNTKINDAGAMVDSWEMVLGSYKAESVYKATRLHMEKSPFFPTPSDVKNQMLKAELIYDNTTITALPTKAASHDEKIDEWLEAFCEWIGFGCEENDSALDDFYENNPEMLERMRGILPYEI